MDRPIRFDRLAKSDGISLRDRALDCSCLLFLLLLRSASKVCCCWKPLLARLIASYECVCVCVFKDLKRLLCGLLYCLQFNASAVVVVVVAVVVIVVAAAVVV